MPTYGQYSRVLRLLFTPSNDQPTEFATEIKDNICVVCGVKNDLSLHHVIPACIRARFPDNEKNHTHQWCVLLCTDCHLRAEDVARPIYAAHYNLIHSVVSNHPQLRANAAMITLWKIKRSAYSCPQEKINRILAQSIHYQSFDEIPQNKSDLLLFNDKQIQKEIANREISKMLVEMGGVEAVKQIFKAAFLTLKPEFLPAGFLKDWR